MLMASPNNHEHGIDNTNTRERTEGDTRAGLGGIAESDLRPHPEHLTSSDGSLHDKASSMIEKWSLGILNDRETEEVPGTVLLLSSNRNEPLGIEHQAARHSGSSMPAQGFRSRRPSTSEKKKTPDGKMILDPQPDDSLNDPLNWPAWRRDTALLSLGFYCMVGGGVTPILAAGFNDVAQTFNVTYAQVALTTGLYMMGLGVGSVIFSPTAILFGKRPVYLGSAILFVLTSIWCAKAPSYAHLAAARVFQGISVSPVECLPSATIAEIFFLHERAFRVGIYTLLLLGGKNLVPLVSAVIIQSLDWRWVFWIVAMIAGFGFALLFFFVPETFWDRTPRPKSRRPSTRRRSVTSVVHLPLQPFRKQSELNQDTTSAELARIMTPRQQRLHEHEVHARFAEMDRETSREQQKQDHKPVGLAMPPAVGSSEAALPYLHNLNSPYYLELDKNDDYLGSQVGRHTSRDLQRTNHPKVMESLDGAISGTDKEELQLQQFTSQEAPSSPPVVRYTTQLRRAPPKTYKSTLKPWNGRLGKSNWFHVALRPFVLFAYPAVLWSTLVYSLSVGWLIVLSESVSNVYRSRHTYNFSALGTGLVYLSPFIGGVLGTAVAGKVSDIIVRWMSRRNGGVYEPEFRLVMALPVAVTTAIGLMGFGWSAQERDRWIVPTFFFGVISFGCSLGSTTAITFCVDSYRQYAGEALVTLNFSKNIFHGLVFSLFFARWLESDGSKTVFVAIGCIHIACLLTTIPMYIFGKRGRMWTVRKAFMENL